MGIEEPRTINEMFKKAVRQRAGAALMSFKRDKKWFDITGKELLERVSNLAVGLHKLGVKPGDRIALLAESSPDWSITDYAILSNSAVNVPIYPTQALDQVEFILKNSGARILFISTNRQLKRIKSVLDNYKNSERPLVYLFEEPKDASVSNIGEIEKQGAQELRNTPELFERISSLSQPSDLATVIYTSGTTGIPKGVMLTHHNLTSNALRSGEVFDLHDDDQAMSFLPLSHVFERTVLYIYMWYGVKVSFAKGVETVAEDIKEIRPTIVTAVPRLFEKIYATINKKASDATPLQQKIFHRAMKVGRQVAGYIDRQERVPLKLSLEYKVLDRLVFSKWKEAVGGRIRFFVSAAPPCRPK
ncbi:MAG: AMP-binding protein [Acidobacteria bacterium]|nr:AMP-binding protein [Acidobacteriota bacterium]